MIAIITAVISTILGIFAARASARYDFPAKRGIVGFIMVPLVLPEIIVGVALLVVLVQLGLALSSWTVIIGHVLICTPFSLPFWRRHFAIWISALKRPRSIWARARLAHSFG